MIIIYGENIYPLENKKIDSGLISNFEDCIFENEVRLKLHEESFKILYYGLDSIDLTNISKKKVIELYQGLNYFLASKEFLNNFKQKTLYNKILRKEIEEKIKNEVRQMVHREIKTGGFYTSVFLNENLSINFFKKIIKKNSINWYLFGYNRSIPVKFFERLIFKRKYHVHDWEFLCWNNKIPESFFKKVIDEGYELDWSMISQNKNLSADFFEEAINQGRSILWEFLCINEKLPISFFEKMKTLGHPVKWYYLFLHKNQPVEFYEKILKEQTEIYFRDWYYICKIKTIPVEFFERIIKKGYPVDWTALCSNTSIPFKFFEEAIKQNQPVNWYNLCWFSKIPLEIAETKINYSELTRNKNLPLSFFKKHNKIPLANIIESTIIHDGLDYLPF
jgi:hypothetical protein